jgi:4-diphosphocytidyl-2-C-methyl-D-erythritol kinase
VTVLARTVAIPARAKLNLDLAIAGVRGDGLHELRTTMQAIELHDLLSAEPAANTELIVSGLEIGDRTRTNSVLAAHAAMESAARRSLPARFHLHKRIPPGSGLGGASSDAAAAMRALRAIFCLELDLRPVAASVGADVTFFLSGGAARVAGAGELVAPIDTAEAWFAVAWPGIELSTAAVYRAWDDVGGDGPNQLRRAAARADARVDEFARRLGERWQMTGSGSAFFARCATRQEAEATAAPLDCWTAVTHAVGPWT